jgi:hypothetical protein
VTFEGEQGLDEGGVTKVQTEFFNWLFVQSFLGVFSFACAPAVSA